MVLTQLWNSVCVCVCICNYLQVQPWGMDMFDKYNHTTAEVPLVPTKGDVVRV